MTCNATGGGPILGRLRAADGKGIVRMQDSFDTGMDDVWSALTDPRRLARWLGTVDGELRVGGAFRAHFDTSGWEGTGRVVVCESPRRLLVMTRHAKQPDEHAVEAILTSDGERTILVLEERGMRLDQLAGYGAGVQIHMEDLADHLAGNDRRESGAEQRWQDLLPAYQRLAANVTS